MGNSFAATLSTGSLYFSLGMNERITNVGRYLVRQTAISGSY